MYKLRCGLFILLLSVFFIQMAGFSQTPDSVDVTFYYKPGGNPSIVYLPGEFNNWGNNNGGVISDPQFAMAKDLASGVWHKTVRLRVGGPNPLPSPNSVPGAYQYKFNENGASNGWLPDPLNPRRNPNDNNNSYLFIKDPTIHYLLPNSTDAIGTVRTRFPEITAYIFPATSSSVDTASIALKIDNITHTNIGNRYNTAEKQLAFTFPNPLGDGVHELILTVQSSAGTQNSDTTTFTIQADVAQILSLPAETWKSSWRIQGAFFDATGGYDSTVTAAQILRIDSTWTVSATNGKVDTVLSLLEGDNYFRLRGDVGGQLQTSDSVNFIRKVNHSPSARIDITPNGSMIDLSAANSSDPDGQQLTFLWDEDPGNPEALGISGQTATEISVAKPAAFGEYYLELAAEDPDGNRDSTRAFFVVQADTPEVAAAGYADNPYWVKDGQIYLMFFKSFTAEGTIQAAIPHLDYIKAMGFNVIWVLPVMDVNGDIDNGVNIGYNIIDFYNVDPGYGSNQDFKDFVSEAHAMGLKVILDVTPNHTSREHPFAREARLFGNLSPYWNYYQTHFINHNTNGLGQCVTPEGIYYYCAFSDALLNYEWSDLDARNYMIDAYDYWVEEFGIDGYRFDVYWGPHRRYGDQYMGIPVRESLKHIKPDILLLGEDDGTGVGTEVLYADDGGGLDVSYDFKLYFNAIRSFSFTSASVNTLHGELYNGGFYPGENSYFLRFMESQDEDRISYVHNSFTKTMPLAAAVFTAPGMPLLYSGQEVGFGKGMGAPGEPDLNVRRRGVIDWNFPGKDVLQPHYQRLGQIRAQFPAFRQHKKDTNGDGQVNDQDESDFIRVTTGNGIVYAFLRPYPNENGFTVANFSGNPQTATMDLTTTGLKFSGGFDPNATYWVNNLYADTSYQRLGSELSAFSVTLAAYGSAIFSISTEEESVLLPTLPPLVSIDPGNGRAAPKFELFHNYPNPFNPETTVEFEIPFREHVKLSVYNILGQRVKTLADDVYQSGRHRLQWDGRNEQGERVASGIYILHIKAGSFARNQRMVLLR